MPHRSRRRAQCQKASRKDGSGRQSNAHHDQRSKSLLVSQPTVVYETALHHWLDFTSYVLPLELPEWQQAIALIRQLLGMSFSRSADCASEAMRLNADDFVSHRHKTESIEIGGSMTEETPPQQIDEAD